MFATSIGGRLLGAAIGAGLALGALSFGVGTAAAAPAQPVSTDIPFLPTPTDPGSVVPTASSPLGLPGVGGLVPLITDTTKLLTAGNDPNTLLSDTQTLLNDAGSLLGVPVGMPNVSSFVPANGVPNVPAPLAPPSPLSPSPLSPSAPLSPLTPLSPPGPLTPSAPVGPIL